MRTTPPWLPGTKPERPEGGAGVGPGSGGDGGAPCPAANGVFAFGAAAGGPEAATVGVEGGAGVATGALRSIEIEKPFTGGSTIVPVDGTYGSLSSVVYSRGSGVGAR